MPSSWPESPDDLESFNPAGTLASEQHSAKHNAAVDAINAMQAAINAGVYVGPDAPPGPPARYLWWQTFEDGSMTLWVEDGT